MKRVAVIIVIIGLIAFIYAIRNKLPMDKIAAPTLDRDGISHPDPSNATFIIDDETITLSAGRNEKAIAPGSSFTEETILMDKFAYGDINQDGKEDTALLLARYGGGSGTFIYAAVFISGPVTYRGSEAVFIGDRIAPQSISIDNGIVTVKYLDRGPDEAFAAEPTIPMSKQFVYKNGEFAER